MATTAQTIQSYYQTILARTGSASEVAFWVNQVDTVGIPLAQVQTDFATSPEALANVAPILQMYQADLGRAADSAGLTAWVGLEESGTSLATIAADIAGSAESQTHNGFTAGAAPTTAFVTNLYKSILGRQPETAAVVASWVGSGLSDAQIVAAIGGSAEAIADDKAAVTTYLATGGGASAVGGTFTLTTGVDAGAAFTQGPNATFIGTVGATAAATTLNAGDSLTGVGTGDTLQIVETAGSTASNELAGVTLAGIQTVSLQNTTVGIADIDLTLSPSVTKVVALNTAGNATPGFTGGIDSFTGLAAGTQVIASGAGTGAGGTAGNVSSDTTVDFAYATPTSAVSVGVDGGANGVTFRGTGTETAANISSTGAANGKTGLTTTDNFDLTAGTNTLTTLAVNATTNLVATLQTGDYAATAALTVSGAATSVNLGSAANFKTIDASKLTAGGLTIGLGTNTTSFVGGANNNVVTTAAVAATAASSINAGKGTANTLVIGASTDVNTAALAALYAGFSTLTDNVSGAIDVSKFTNSTITAENVSGTASLSGLSTAQAAAITVTATGSTPTFAVTGATSLNPATIGLTVNDGATTGAAGSSTVTVVPTAPDVGTVNLTVANAIDTAVVNLTAVTAPTTQLVIAGPGIAQVTLGTAPANVTLDGVAGNMVTLGGGGSNVNLGTSAAQTINLSGGRTTPTAADTITVGADANAVYGTKGSATVTGDIVNLSNFTLNEDTLKFTAGAPTTLADATTITAAQTGVTGLTASSASGILSFVAGPTDTTNSLQQDVFAAANILDTAGASQVAAFINAGNTYVVETPSAGASLATDHMFQLNGVSATAVGGTGAGHILVG
jgi:hypothetical protein